MNSMADKNRFYVQDFNSYLLDIVDQTIAKYNMLPKPMISL